MFNESFVKARMGYKRIYMDKTYKHFCLVACTISKIELELLNYLIHWFCNLDLCGANQRKPLRIKGNNYCIFIIGFLQFVIG